MRCFLRKILIIFRWEKVKEKWGKFVMTFYGFRGAAYVRRKEVAAKIAPGMFAPQKKDGAGPGRSGAKYINEISFTVFQFTR